MRSTRFRLCLLMLLSILVVFTTTQAAVTADSFVPQPGLRLFLTGTLGSDGTVFEKTVVVADIARRYLATAADDLINQEHPLLKESKKNVVSARKNQFYSLDSDGVSMTVSSVQGKSRTFLWLPATIEVGIQWESEWKQKREILATNVTVATPAGEFAGCVLVASQVNAGNVGMEHHYIAPGLGLIKVQQLRGSKEPRLSFELTKIERINPDDAKILVEGLLK